MAAAIAAYGTSNCSGEPSPVGDSEQPPLKPHEESTSASPATR